MLSNVFVKPTQNSSTALYAHAHFIDSLLSVSVFVFLHLYFLYTFFVQHTGFIDVTIMYKLAA